MSHIIHCLHFETVLQFPKIYTVKLTEFPGIAMIKITSIILLASSIAHHHDESISCKVSDVVESCLEIDNSESCLKVESDVEFCLNVDVDGSMEFKSQLGRCKMD